MTTLAQAKRALDSAIDSTLLRKERGDNVDAVADLLLLGVTELQRAASLKGLQRSAAIRRVDSLLKMAVGHGIERTYSFGTTTRWGKGH